MRKFIAGKNDKRKIVVTGSLKRLFILQYAMFILFLFAK